MQRLLLVLLALPGAQAVLADSAADEFGARHWPIEPVLTVNKEPALCAEVLEQAREAFSSRAPDFDVASAEATKRAPLAWGPLSVDSPAAEASPLGRLDLDLDGSGAKQVVIYRSNEHSWRGSWNYAYVFASANKFAEAKEQVESAWSKLPGTQYPSPTDAQFGGREYYPSAVSELGKETGTGNVWADHSLFEWRAKYYFFSGTLAFDRQRVVETSVYRLRASGRVEEACRVGLPGAKEQSDRFRASAGVASLLAAISTMGAGGEDCGTLHSGLVHDEQARAAESRAALRPWAVSSSSRSISGAPYYVYDERTEAYLELWSHLDPWTRREYQTFLEHVSPAGAGIASYLSRLFAMPASRAKEASRAVVRDLIGARFLLPGGFGLNEDSRELYFGRYSVRDALITRDRSRLDSLLASGPAAAPDRGEQRRENPLAGAAANAVEWSYGLARVLEAGANPNEPNAFGKTPLMAAAHMNRVDSVRALLRAGAKVNVRTQNMFSCGGDAFQRVGRTALTYAAENASPVLMRALLEAGADPTVTDSKGNGLDFYLARNPRLSGAESRLGLVALAKLADRWAGPSFKCEIARTKVEQQICRSEVLRIFDVELNQAYNAFRARHGQAGVPEQREWLSRRNERCIKDAEPTECLAEATRTRIRYLHARLAE